MASFGVRDKLKFWGAHLGGTLGVFPTPDVIFMVKFGFLMPENTEAPNHVTELPQLV